MSKKIWIEQYRSPARRPAYQLATLKGLGLNKMNRRREVVDTPATRGMIASIAHMVRIVEGPKPKNAKN